MAKRKVQFRIPEVLAERMEAIAEDLGCSVNAWAIRALAYSAKNHVPLDTYLNTAGKGRAKNVRLSPFHGLPVDELGVPEGMNLPEGELELHRKRQEGGEAAVKQFMALLWTSAGITTDYTDSHLAETLRALASDD